jgi:hypothetical protein
VRAGGEVHRNTLLGARELDLFEVLVQRTQRALVRGLGGRYVLLLEGLGHGLDISRKRLPLLQ